jgi:hypothetical protein
MKVVLIGGSCLIGSRLVTLLGEAGHEALAASRRAGMNVVTGQCMSNALVGADVIVNVTNAPPWEPQATLDIYMPALFTSVSLPRFGARAGQSRGGSGSRSPEPTQTAA